MVVIAGGEIRDRNCAHYSALTVLSSRFDALEFADAAGHVDWNQRFASDNLMFEQRSPCNGSMRGSIPMTQFVTQFIHTAVYVCFDGRGHVARHLGR